MDVGRFEDRRHEAKNIPGKPRKERRAYGREGFQRKGQGMLERSMPLTLD